MLTPPRVSKIEDRLIGKIDAALRQRPPKTAPTHPRSPACCSFAGGKITDAIAENCERVSAAWRERCFQAGQ